MIFRYNYKFNTKRIFNLTKIKKIKILDFGCGIGSWSIKDLDSKIIEEITLYDKDKKLISHLKKKYPNKKILVNFNFNAICKKNDYNLIIFSSVIQYIPQSRLKKIIDVLCKNKKVSVIFSDVPFLPRIVEFFFIPLFNIKRFFFILSLIFSRKYIKTNFFLYQKKDFDCFKKKFKVVFVRNLHDLKFLRYSVIMKPK